MANTGSSLRTKILSAADDLAYIEMRIAHLILRMMRYEEDELKWSHAKRELDALREICPKKFGQAFSIACKRDLRLPRPIGWRPDRTLFALSEDVYNLPKGFRVSGGGCNGTGKSR